MTLRVAFSINPTELLIGERPHCVLTLANTGESPIRVIHPQTEGGCSFRVLAALSGDETYIRAKMSRGETPIEIPLAPGQKVQTDVRLPDEADLSLPGDYAITAIYGYNSNVEMVESPAVRIKVKPLAVRHLAVDSVQGSSVNAAFINTVADPPDVAIARFIIRPEGGLKAVRSVAKASLTSRPFLSLPDNQGWANGTWAAWLDDRQLSFVHMDDLHGTSATGELALSITSGRIIPPLYIMNSQDETQRELGGVVVWGDAGVGSYSQVQIFGLHATEKVVKGEMLSRAAVAIPRPEWASSHVLSKGEKLLTFLYAHSDMLRLGRMPWPEMSDGRAELTQLAEWKAGFVAAGATLGAQDEIFGAALMWTGPLEYRTLELLGWRIDPDGSYSETYRKTLPWSWRVPIDVVKVRVRADGIPAVLILNGHDRRWSVWDGYGAALIPLPEPYGSTKKEIDIAFLNESDVILIAAQTVGGVAVKRIDGSDLPPMPH